MSPTFSPISLGGIGRATVNGTSGSPTVNTNARPGKTIYEFNGSGSITIGSAGYAEIAIIGGGAGGIVGSISDMANSLFGSGGGGGGVHQDTEYFFNATTHNITVGAGGSNVGSWTSFSYSGGGGQTASSFPGSFSAIGNTRVPGGGPAQQGNSSHFGSPYGVLALSQNSWFVASGGGISGTRPYAIGNVFLGAGALGGTTNHATGAGGGGGGASGGAGGNTGGNNVPGNGGSGTTVNITGTGVVYGGGGGGQTNGTGGSGGGGNGGGGAGSAGTANSGGGGGGGGNSVNSAPTNSGGSGKVIVVIG